MSHLVRLDNPITEGHAHARPTAMPGGAVFLLSWVAMLAACAGVWYLVLKLAL
jgi:hypothetical protein